MHSIIDITLSAEQLEGTTATLQQWLVAVGDKVSADEPLAEIETDKLAMEVCAPCAGIVQALLVSPGDGIEVGTVLGRIDKRSEAMAVEAPEIQSAPNPSHRAQAANIENTDSARHLLGPAVRRLLREHALDLNAIEGSGHNGRVTRNDVIAYLKNQQPQKNAHGAAATNAKVPAAESLVGRRLPHSDMRRAIARNMVESLLHTSPHVTSVFEMDMSRVIKHKSHYNKPFAERGVKLSFTAYFLAACVKAVNAVPEINAHFHKDALEIFDNINIGVATALDSDGLVVPVVHDVQQKDFFEIARALQQQTAKARNKELQAVDVKNATFTISNHGVSGSLVAVPIIIKQPQVAILGVGKLDKRVVVATDNGVDTMRIKPMCYVSLSIDHRAVDAFQTNKFLGVFVDTIERWEV